MTKKKRIQLLKGNDFLTRGSGNIFWNFLLNFSFISVCLPGNDGNIFYPTTIVWRMSTVWLRRLWTLPGRSVYNVVTRLYTFLYLLISFYVTFFLTPEIHFRLFFVFFFIYINFLFSFFLFYMSEHIILPLCQTEYNARAAHDSPFF